MSPHALAAPPASPALPELTALTRRYADEVRAGRHRVVVDPAQRWYSLLRSDDTVDVWLITWATEQFAELHDHGRSLGALSIVRGALTEDRWVPGSHALAGRRITAGRSVGFGRGYVHEVSNPEAQAAVSVHAYSPPLTEMSYYALEPRSDGAGSALRRTRTATTAPGSSEGVG
ncbi:cysteine dioxygenase [Pseudonocardia humida]|uniref:Cysteine dioxygenase family protein n=1 Tax=Pseudonocardia humida TaxID=2800819 RepID=A0ABT1AD33_9PSEU|nr:cysteine dioxygenase family protein [Pseudonocardia humida]MCO1660952.1 cysteine dioxygenase family protein [Pseudonocardia humida]